MATIGNEIKQKTSKQYYCINCDYTTCRKNNYETHIQTNKHKINQLATNGNEIKQKTSKNYQCQNCDKNFNDRSGLWRHKKKCNNDKNLKETSNTIPEITPELIMSILKQNSDLQNVIITQNNTILDLAKNSSITNSNNNNNNNTNSHNKSFNLQFFLNETCKDAMNIMDFVDSIKLQLSDLERVGELGYVEGISNIIVKNLNNLDVTQRPVHCTDKKREVLYVKDEDKWEKEDENKVKIHKVIKKVALKNQRMIPKFKEQHPDCGKSASKFSDQYNKIILEAMGGIGDNDKEKEERIVKNISKNVILDKE
jgi:ribosomal protein L37AE/L43A